MPSFNFQITFSTRLKSKNTRWVTVKADSKAEAEFIAIGKVVPKTACNVEIESTLLTGV